MAKKVEVRVPTLGESVTEAVVVRWLVDDGTVVSPDDALLELETDKATVEVPAERGGLVHILKQVGETVGVGDVIATIEAATDGQRRANGPGPEEIGAARTAAAPLSPAVRRLVQEHALQPEGIPATGKGGRLTKADVTGFLEGEAGKTTVDAPRPVMTRAEPAPGIAASEPGPAGQAEEIVPMGPIRKRIAERLVAAQHTAAILTTFNEIDMSQVMRLRQQHKARFQETHGVGLGFMSFFARACVAGLTAFPRLNAEIRDDAIVYKHYVHLGIAVGTPRGLVVPVIRNVERSSFAEIEKAIEDVARRAREGKLSPQDLSGGTFTISNGGVYGSLLSTPILNPPQSGILGMHKIEKRPVVLDGDQIAVRPMMYVALSYDHRIVDGEQAVGFLVRVKECLEDPARLLFEI